MEDVIRQLNQIRDRVGKSGDLRSLKGLCIEAGQLIDKYLSNDHLLKNSCISLKRSIETLQYRDMGGMMSYSEKNREQSILVNTFLELVRSIEEQIEHDEMKKESSAHENESSSPLTRENPPENTVKTILFITAAPDNKHLLRADDEVKAIRKELEFSNFKDSFKLVEERGVERDNLAKIIRENNPFLLHVSVHGNREKGLMFQDSNGKEDFIDSKDLNHILRRQDERGFRIHCLLLNVCNSAWIAQQCPALADFVIAVKDFIQDKPATRFTTGFYQVFFEEVKVEDAYDEGLYMLKNREDKELYVISSRDDFSQLKLSEQGNHKPIDETEFGD
ncbi:MAG: hypothetical protein H6566_29645 [Lewinellaceae bacterium]|nr:hypothetical protein [Lewinellaceae bacterium]